MEIEGSPSRAKGLEQEELFSLVQREQVASVKPNEICSGDHWELKMKEGFLITYEEENLRFVEEFSDGFGVFTD